MGQLGNLLGKTVRTVMFVRGVLAIVAGALLLVAGLWKWDLKVLGLGAFAVVFGVWYVRRSRVPRSYEDRDVMSALPPVARPTAPPRFAPPRPAVKPIEPLVPRVEQRPSVEYATDDGGPRFLR